MGRIRRQAADRRVLAPRPAKHGIPFNYGTLALLPPDGQQGSFERWVVHLGYGDDVRSFEPVAFGDEFATAPIPFGRVYYGLLGLENARFPRAVDGRSTRRAGRLTIERASIAR